MDEQNAGLNAAPQNANMEATADDGGLNFYINTDGMEVTETGEPLAMGNDGDGTGGGDDGETPQVPTTDTTGENAGDNPPDGNETETASETPAPRWLDLRVNHADKRVDVNAMNDGDLTALLQKAYAFDDMKAAQERRDNAEKFRAYCAGQIPKLMSEDGLSLTAAKGVAAMNAQMEGLTVHKIDVSEDGVVTLAGDYANGAVPIPGETAQESDRKPDRDSAPKPETDEKAFEKEVKKFRIAFPDVKEITPEIKKLYDAGFTLTEAALLTRINATRMKTAQMAQENKKLRQNAEAASRAPVRGVSGGGISQKGNTAESEFERAFLAGLKGESPLISR